MLPFRTNNYVTDELIDWNDIPADPFFVLNFPQKGMLKPEHYNKVASIMIRGVGPQRLKKVTNAIQLELSPHPAGQIKDNRPTIDGEVL